MLRITGKIRDSKGMTQRDDILDERLALVGKLYTKHLASTSKLLAELLALDNYIINWNNN